MSTRSIADNTNDAARTSSSDCPLMKELKNEVCLFVRTHRGVVEEITDNVAMSFFLNEAMILFLAGKAFVFVTVNNENQVSTDEDREISRYNRKKHFYR